MTDATPTDVFYMVLAIAGPVLIGLASTIFWIWALVHSGRRLGNGEKGQLGWVIAISLTHVLGALAYTLFGRRVAQVGGQPG